MINEINESAYANYLRSIDVFILDEASVVYKPVLEAIDALMQDICQSLLPFGGKVFVLGGDFRQNLPIHHQEITTLCIIALKIVLIGTNLCSCLCWQTCALVGKQKLNLTTFYSVSVLLLRQLSQMTLFVAVLHCLKI